MRTKLLRLGFVALFAYLLFSVGTFSLQAQTEAHCSNPRIVYSEYFESENSWKILCHTSDGEMVIATNALIGTLSPNQEYIAYIPDTPERIVEILSIDSLQVESVNMPTDIDPIGSLSWLNKDEVLILNFDESRRPITEYYPSSRFIYNTISKTLIELDWSDIVDFEYYIVGYLNTDDTYLITPYSLSSTSFFYGVNNYDAYQRYSLPYDYSYVNLDQVGNSSTIVYNSACSDAEIVESYACFAIVDLNSDENEVIEKYTNDYVAINKIISNTETKIAFLLLNSDGSNNLEVYDMRSNTSIRILVDQNPSICDFDWIDSFQIVLIAATNGSCFENSNLYLINTVNGHVELLVDDAYRLQVAN